MWTIFWLCLRNDLGLEDQLVVRVVDAESVGDVARPRDELDGAPRHERLWCVDRPRELHTRHVHELRPRPGGLAVGDVEDRAQEEREEREQHDTSQPVSRRDHVPVRSSSSGFSVERKIMNAITEPITTAIA